MTELATYQPGALSEQMDFARAVVQRPEGAAASLLPQAYRDNPANVLLAVGLGGSMGLSPAESLYRIDVIQGKPCASAELIASNVRKAGHKLRIKVTEDPPSATCTIIRNDDPEPVTVTRDMAWAQQMGLHTKDNYRKQPSTMLSWRAISACARLACSEALYGVAYTADELDDMPRATVTAEQVAPADLLAQQLVTVEESAEVVPDPGYVDAEPMFDYRSTFGKAFYASINAEGIPEQHRIRFVSEAIGRPITSTKELTDAEARDLLDNLPALAADFLAEVAQEGAES